MKKSTFEDKVAKIHINLFFSIKVISIFFFFLDKDYSIKKDKNIYREA